MQMPTSVRSAVAEEHHIANLEIRPEGLEVLVDGCRLGLTVREYQLFAALASRPNRVLQRAELYETVWGGTIRSRDRSVDVLIRKIRDKLERCAPEWRYIHTHFGVGYRFHPERADTPAGQSPPPATEDGATASSDPA